MTERRIKEERRKQDLGCKCARGAKSVDRGCSLAARESDRTYIRRSNCVSQSDPNCTPLPMGVQPAQPARIPTTPRTCGACSADLVPNFTEGSWSHRHHTGCKFDGKCAWIEAVENVEMLGPFKFTPVAPPETPAAAQQEALDDLIWEFGEKYAINFALRYYDVVGEEETRRLGEIVADIAIKWARSQLAAAESRVVEATRLLTEFRCAVDAVLATNPNAEVPVAEALAFARAKERVFKFVDGSEVGAAPSQTQNAEVSNGDSPAAADSSALPIGAQPTQHGVLSAGVSSVARASGYSPNITFRVPTMISHGDLNHFDYEPCSECERLTPSAPDTTQLPTQEKK